MTFIHENIGELYWVLPESRLCDGGLGHTVCGSLAQSSYASLGSGFTSQTSFYSVRTR